MTRREVRAGDVSPGDYVLTYGREVREVRTYESGRAVAIVFTGSDGMSARHLARDILTVRRAPRCACAVHRDGSVTTSLCPVHADTDPCLTMARVTGRRRTGTIRRGVCTHCGHGGTS